MFLNKLQHLLPVINRSSSCLFHEPLLKALAIQPQATTWLHTSAALDRARKGTRERKMKVAQANRRKKLAKMPDRPKGFIPYHERRSIQGGRASPRLDHFLKKAELPEDDVVITKYYKWPKFTVGEALEQFQQTYHPEIYNLPDNLVYLYMELSLATEKKTRFVAEVTDVVTVPHPFTSGQQRSVAVLTDDPAQQAAATEAGAQLVVGREVVPLLRSKEVSVQDFDYVVCDLPMLPEISSRGVKALFKKKFPNMRSGTAVADTRTVVHQFLTGIKYDAEKDLFDKDFAKLEIPVGRLDMGADALRDNIRAILDSVYAQRGRRAGHFPNFLTNVRLVSPPQKEMLYLDTPTLDLPYLGRRKPKPEPVTGAGAEDEAQAAA